MSDKDKELRRMLENITEVNNRLLNRPHFTKCENIGCPDRFNCKERLRVQPTNGGYTVDYFCEKRNVYVYWE